MSELKPCPLCGTTNQIGLQKAQVFDAFNKRIGKEIFYCAQCDLATRLHDNPSLSVEYWNRLVDKIRAKLAAAEADVKRLETCINICEAANEALREDKERLDWLDSRQNIMNLMKHAIEGRQTDTIRQAIDAARTDDLKPGMVLKGEIPQ